jgi:hypothetical protein
MALRRRRKGDVVSLAENNTKGGVRIDFDGRQKTPIKRTDVTTLLCIVHGRMFCTIN